MTGLVVRYKAIQISWLLSREDLVSQSGKFKMYSFMGWQPVEVAQKLRCGRLNEENE